MAQTTTRGITVTPPFSLLLTPYLMAALVIVYATTTEGTDPCL